MIKYNTGRSENNNRALLVLVDLFLVIVHNL